MSIGVDGYRMHTTQLDEIMQILHPFRTRYETAFQDHLTRSVTRMAIPLLDATLTAPTWDQLIQEIQAWYPDRIRVHESRLSRMTPAEIAIDMLQSLQLEAHQDREPRKWDWHCRVTLVPYRGWTYAILDANRPAILMAWEELPQLEEYGYYTNTDRPDGMSASTWATRGRHWETILQQIVDGLGTTVDLTLPWTMDTVHSTVPDATSFSWDERCVSCAREHLWQFWTYYRHEETLTQFREWLMDTPPGQQSLATWTSHFQRFLPQEWSSRECWVPDLRELFNRVPVTLRADIQQLQDYEIDEP